MKRIVYLSAVLLISLSTIAQSKHKVFIGQWRAAVVRNDQKEIVFNFETKYTQGKWTLQIRNGAEKLTVKNLYISKDSVNFEMPVFESSFKSAIQADGTLKGSWFKGTAQNTQEWAFKAEPGKSYRFLPADGKSLINISGRWEVSITRPNGTIRPAIAEFVQKGNYLTGTILTPSGDYRYLEGIVTGKQMFLSVFDGSHAYYFNANIESTTQLINGIFYAGISGQETWSAIKNAVAKLPEVGNTPQLKEGYTKLDFSFKDLDRNIVSIKDDRFKNKVVIVQVMGSWCPNCMDETRFLSEYYNQNKQRGVEIIALAYEYSTDYERSRNSLLKFKERFNVNYPMLVTGVWVNDSLKTEKTLPQISPIKVFPTTIFIDKQGNVRKIEAGFYGPGSGQYFEAFKKEFYATMDGLLKEN